MSPPPQPKKDRRPSDPEIYEPNPDYDTKIHIPLPYPATPETAGERREAGRMAAKGESSRGRTDISLDTLRETTKTRRFDVETPRKINEINFFESPEIQQERFDALRDVTVVMLANILHANQNIEQKLDLGNFENVAQLRTHMSGIRPGPAENAAFHKILELREHPNSEVSRHFASQWESLASAARQVERDIRALETADLRSRHAPEEKGIISKTVSFAKKHPLISLGIALAGAYGAYKIFSGIREKLSPAPSSEKKEGGAEKKTGFMGWLVGAGVAILAIFGLGKFLGKDGIKKFFKEKMGWDLSGSRAVQTLTLISQGKFKEAWEVAWKGVDENAEFHGKIAKLISDDARTEVTGKTLFELKDEEFEDFMESSSQWGDELSVSVGETGVLGTLSKPFLDSRRKNEEQIAVRGFLKKHAATIRKIMPVREETTLEEVFQKLYAHLTGQPSGATVAAVAGGAAAGRALSETSERDRAIELLPSAKKARAIENEKVLNQKINFAYINQMNETVTDRERMLRALLAKSLKPGEREDVEEKLETLFEQKGQLAKLIENHNTAYLAYRDALSQNADEETLILRFTELIEAKEFLEEHFDDIFAREDWQVFQALAATHALRFITFAHRRWFKTQDLKTDHANYRFDRLKERISPKRLKENLQRRFRKTSVSNLSQIRRQNAQLFDDMDKTLTGWDVEEGAGKEAWARKHFEQIGEFEERVAQQHRQLDRLLTDRTQALEKAIKAGDKTKIGRLQKLIKATANEKARLELGNMRNFGNAFDRWQQAFKGDPHQDVYKEGINKLRMYMRKALRRRLEKDASKAAAHAATKVWVRRGRIAFLTGSIILGGETLADEKTGRTKAYKQAGLGAAPVIGTYLDFYSAIIGKEKFTGRKLDVKDRTIAALFGTVGAATDFLSLVGIGLLGRATLTGVKSGLGFSKAVRAAKMAQKLDTAKDSAEAGKIARRFETIEKARKIAFRVSLGTSLGVPAYMFFEESASLPVSDEFQKFLSTIPESEVLSEGAEAA